MLMLRKQNIYGSGVGGALTHSVARAGSIGEMFKTTRSPRPRKMFVAKRFPNLHNGYSGSGRIFWCVANINFDKCPEINGAMVTVKWLTKDLLSI